MSEKSYLEHMEDLQAASSKISSMESPDIDQIIPIMEKGMAAYSAMKDRIDKVDQFVRLMSEPQENNSGGPQ